MSIATEIKDQKGLTVLNRYTESTVATFGFIVIDSRNEEKQFMRLSRGSMRLLNIPMFPNVEFVFLADNCYLCSTDLKRGYNVSIRGNDGRISSHIAVKTIQSQMDLNDKQIKLMLKKTGLEYKGRPLFKIDFTKPFHVNKRCIR